MTAYDLRISDWSSDVCSSDLPGWTFPSTRPILAASRASASCLAPALNCSRPELPGAGWPPWMEIPAAVELPMGDRKSVVQGKRVTVREDLGGCRIIKKIKKYKISEKIHI